MKSLGYSINILEKTNKIIGSTELDFSKVTAGAYFKIKNSPIIYTISSNEKILFVKDFSIVSSNIINVKGDAGLYLLKNDCIKLSYKEYEFNILTEIKNTGVGYKKGDLLFINDGVASINLSNNSPEITKFEVSEVGSNGEVKNLNIKNRGKYLIPPGNTAHPTTSGDGQNLILELSFLLLDNRQIIERTIINILRKNEECDLILDYALPIGLKEGKISAEKWQLSLTNTYLGPNLFDKEYEVSTDFSFNYRIPFLAKNSNSVDSVYNLGVRIIDSKLKDIEDKLELIEKKLDKLA